MRAPACLHRTSRRRGKCGARRSNGIHPRYVSRLSPHGSDFDLITKPAFEHVRYSMLAHAFTEEPTQPTRSICTATRTREAVGTRLRFAELSTRVARLHSLGSPNSGAYKTFPTRAVGQTPATGTDVCGTYPGAGKKKKQPAQQ